MSNLLLGENGQPVNPPSRPSEQECFELFTKLAARVTNLRTILQEPEVIKRKEAVDWTEDVKSIIADFVTLTGETRLHVIRRMEKEPPHA